VKRPPWAAERNNAATSSLQENKTIEKAAVVAAFFVGYGARQARFPLSCCTSGLRWIQETNLAQYHAVKPQTDEL
jgi:hypothetical protein